MDALQAILAVQLVASVGLFSYAGWLIDRRRKAMRYLSIDERRRLRRIMMTATAVLFAAFTAWGSLLMM
ncbi:MAG: hypothetical protein ACOYEP_10115 [Limnochordia bacterium]